MSLTTGIRTLTLQILDPQSGNSDSVAVGLTITNVQPTLASCLYSGVYTGSQVSNGSLLTYSPTVNVAVAGTYYVWVFFQMNGQLYGIATQGQLVVNNPVLNWTYGTPAIDDNWQVGVSAWNWIRYRCLITNPNSQAVAKALTLMAKVNYPANPVFSGSLAPKVYNPPIPMGPFYGSTNIPQADVDAVIAWYAANGYASLYGAWTSQTVASQNAAWQAWINATGKVYPSGILIPAGGSYQFDSCLIEGITAPGYVSGNGSTFSGPRGYGYIYEVWLRDVDGFESTHLLLTT